MYNYHLYLVLKQRAFWCVVKQQMKICVKSEDIDLHTLSALKQHACFYSLVKKTKRERSNHALTKRKKSVSQNDPA